MTENCLKLHSTIHSLS